MLFRWMDGSFQSLNGESMAMEVDEFFREVFKMTKFFQQKQSKATEVEKKSKQKPCEDDSGKHESPTVTLCNTVLQEIKEFKVVEAYLFNIVLYMLEGLANNTRCITGACSSSVHSVQSRHKTTSLGSNVKNSTI